MLFENNDYSLNKLNYRALYTNLSYILAVYSGFQYPNKPHTVRF